MESILGDQVRILDILPDDKGTTIRCQLRVVSLADDPIYEALSYVWGSPHHVWDGAYVDQSKANLVSIEISNRRQEVTSNLYAALTRLRSSSKNRPVWIDQLCINQNDYEEKSTQVQLMRKIYSKCTRGLIWLGEIRDDIPENDAATVVEYLVYINALLHSDGSSHLALPNFTRSRPDFERFLKALRSIHRYQCTWWTRIWTLQEAVLPRKADIFWGPFIIPWNTFLDAARFFTFKSFLELDIASGLGKHEQWVMFDIFRYVKALADARYRVHAGGVHMQLDPMHILSRWRGRLASDPRDKIYALSSLYDNKTLPSSGKCDYSLTVQEVFESVTMDLIQLYGDLRPLSMCPRVLCKYATPGIPGWVIDLGSERGYFGPWTTDYRLYDMSNANKGMNEGPIVQHVQGTLDLSGAYVDRIVAVENEQHRTKDVGELLERMRRWYAFLPQVDLEPEYMVKAEALTKVQMDFARLMLNNVLRDKDWNYTSMIADRDLQGVFEFMKTGRPNHTIESMVASTMYRAFFITESGLMGLGHLEMQAGDEVWILSMGKIPFTLRRRYQTKQTLTEYEFFDACYVQGIMQGELSEEEMLRPEEMIRIV